MNEQLKIADTLKYTFPEELPISARADEIVQLLQEKRIVIVCGATGSGKTTFLKHFVSQCRKKFVILAPTGVAALNAGGETIHSFFKFKTDITVDKVTKRKYGKNSIYKNLETIVIR